MLRRTFDALPVCLVLLVLGSPAVADAPTRVIDQSLSPQEAPISFTYAVGGPSEQVLSQTVTAGLAGRLVEVRLPLGCTDGRVILEIRDVDASTGQPGSNVFHRATYPARRFPGESTDALQALSIGGSLDFAAGDRFAIVLTNVGGVCGLWPAAVGDGYPNGTAWAESLGNPISPLGQVDGRDDMPFETVMRIH